MILDRPPAVLHCDKGSRTSNQARDGGVPQAGTRRTPAEESDTSASRVQRDTTIVIVFSLVVLGAATVFSATVVTAIGFGWLREA
ncbi:hypothetical protein [Methylobacterium crusticola]|uniref:hypothetical protein n=1 Tax=Methylobacterium crusticola TaxID=1697972 RepID=UPI000FFC57C1|nr:hypothetical protein [Methylobacterium crusticola]